MTTTTNTTRREVLTLAHALRRLIPSLPWGDCQRAAWKAVRLRAALRTGAASFTFTKEDGTTRAAVGTLNAELYTYTAKGTGAAAENPTVVKFYDLEKGAFRSCRVDRLVTVAAA